MRQLSGGERRRLALALALGFAGLTASRGNLRCNVIVLDEASLVLFRFSRAMHSGSGSHATAVQHRCRRSCSD